MSDGSENDLASVIAERDALLNHDVEVWLDRVVQNSASVADFQNSLSWRITRPLRLVRSYQVRVSRDGFVSANAQALDVVRNRLSRR